MDLDRDGWNGFWLILLLLHEVSQSRSAEALKLTY